MIRLTGLFLLLLFLGSGLKSQTVAGAVIDGKTKEPLAYVHIGVAGKNVGVISNDKGAFNIDLTGIGAEEEIRFSILGYVTRARTKADLTTNGTTVTLEPIAYELEGIVVTSTKGAKVRLGRDKPSKTTTGQSGIDDFGFGGEWGLRVNHEDHKYYLEEVNFHTRFNTVDSVLFRINVYAIEKGLPGKSLLTKPQFTTSYKNDKWITANMLDHELLIAEDVIVTFELVRIWYGDRGNNALFYTMGKQYPEGESFSRESSFAAWEVDARGPIAMYVTGLVQE
ncbi:MAG: carboxypeptidase-like regulatory domain-containing protein [Bacteroidota bacterium]